MHLCNGQVQELAKSIYINGLANSKRTSFRSEEPCHNLWRHEFCGADKTSKSNLINVFGRAKITDNTATIITNHDILWLDITMDNVFIVKNLNARSNFTNNLPQERVIKVLNSFNRCKQIIIIQFHNHESKAFGVIKAQWLQNIGRVKILIHHKLLHKLVARLWIL
ncbi:hypothetical protein MT325_m223R [Paramecium bursaria chlorella virus MT325]|uniref:Uncharacterized protein m223R n=1 Tax=Paramecium bursaria Chlorella virus MT325 TaxID=346932 RepID=A7ITV3_PBCVM|nr:hypothetical protein MT325_m223R [Paramecium bursaria chlorella virus MT325]